MVADAKGVNGACTVTSLVFLDDLGDFSSTQAFIRDVLRLHNQTPVSDHLEVETYTWNVLPEHLRTGGWIMLLLAN
jgi:hypothetical protein